MCHSGQCTGGGSSSLSSCETKLSYCDLADAWLVSFHIGSDTGTVEETAGR